MIPQSFIDTLLQRIDIVDLVGEYVELKKMGANHAACCPFHQEHSPSFTVSAKKQFYHCFGCGAHGTAVSFLIEYAGLSFPDAVESLARRAGLQVPHTQRSKVAGENPEHAACIAALERASRFFQDELAKSEEAMRYLRDRGVTDEMIAQFRIGYAPAGWQALQRAFADYETDRTLVAAGLVIESGDKSKKRYDRFRDRIMFPILERKGAVIGFGGRVLHGGEPKYLNSPESNVFNKGKELYGLFQAQDHIKNAGVVVVVEGYMDTVALSQAGIGNVTATLGTATTETHAIALFRLSNRIIFAFDGDGAGRKAAWRALNTCLPIITDMKAVSFLFLPSGEDPDSFVRTHGVHAFRERMARALPLSEFLIRGLSDDCDTATAEGRAHLFRQAEAHLAKIINAPALAALIRQRVADLVCLPIEEVSRLLGCNDKRGTHQAAASAIRRQPPSPALSLLRLVIHAPYLVRKFAVDVSPDAGGPEARALFAIVKTIVEQASIASPAGLLEAFRGHPLQKTIRQLLCVDFPPAGASFDLEAEFTGAVAKYRRTVIDAEMARLACAPGALTNETVARIGLLLQLRKSIGVAG